MDLLHTYLAALGGTATALTLVGFFGKAIIEHWFNKALKQYETDLEAKAAKSKARFEQSHPEQAKIVLEVYTTCVETDQLLQMFKVYKGIAIHDKGHAAGELVKMHDEITTKMILVEDQLSKRIYFQPALINLLKPLRKIRCIFLKIRLTVF